MKPDEAGAGACAGAAEAPKANEGGEAAAAAKLNPPVLAAGACAGVPNDVACPKAGGGLVGAGAALEPNWNTPDEEGAAAPVLVLPKLKTPD